MADFEHECMPGNVGNVSNMDETGITKSRLPSGELSIADNGIGSGLKNASNMSPTSNLVSLRVFCQRQHLFVDQNYRWR